MRLRCMPPRRTRAENYRPGKLREKPCDRVSMKEIIGLLITLSSLLVGSRGGGGEAGEGEAAAGRGQTEGDAVPAQLPEVRRIPERVPWVVRPMVDAEGTLVLDAGTGRVLYAERSDTVRPLASLTKLMTALVARATLADLGGRVTIVREDYAGNGRTYMYAGDVVTVRDLFFLALVSSSNDAAAALARATGRTHSQFVAAMNEKAKGLRLTRTRFTDPTGLDAGNVSTAQETAPILQTALADPVLREILSTEEYRFTTEDDTRARTAVSTNRLLGASAFDIIGGKTGYIDESGDNFAVEVAGMRNELLTIVVLGAKSEEARFAIVKDLVAWAERAWKF